MYVQLPPLVMGSLWGGQSNAFADNQILMVSVDSKTSEEVGQGFAQNMDLLC